LLPTKKASVWSGTPNCDEAAIEFLNIVPSYRMLI